jgi:hypothetical protein
VQAITISLDELDPDIHIPPIGHLWWVIPVNEDRNTFSDFKIAGLVDRRKTLYRILHHGIFHNDFDLTPLTPLSAIGQPGVLPN